MGLGEKFIPVPKFTKDNVEDSISRFERSFMLKVIYAYGEDGEDIAQLSTGAEDDPFLQTKLYVNSNWSPGYEDVPCWVSRRLSRFFTAVRKKFRQRKASPNLLPCQEKLLNDLLNHPTLLFPSTDKGLGPCAVTYDQYIRDCLVHLLNETVYEQITEEEAMTSVEGVQEQISNWLNKNERLLPRMAKRFIRKHMSESVKSPFGQFYILYKVHKGKKDGRWPTRPVCSDVSSLPHGLGKWVTEQLMPVARVQKSYFKDSFALKDLLDDLRLAPNARFFTADATSMYTNIATEPALAEISKYLREHESTLFKHYKSETLIEALEIIFRNNLFKFGDTFWRQKSGTGMGISPAPPWATIFFALHEDTVVEKWSAHLPFYRRCIDDVPGVWLCHPNPSKDEALWKEFCHNMQQWHGLEWEYPH